MPRDDDETPEQLPLLPESNLDDKTLSEVKALLLIQATKGARCPCCQRFVKLYKRPLGGAMARTLIHLYRHLQDPRIQDKWIHLPKFMEERKIPRSDEAKLTHWGILQAFRAERKDGSPRNGYYTVTELGGKFVRGEVRVPRYVWLYNQTFYGISDGQTYPLETISIVEALGKNFDYRALMSDSSPSS